MSLAKRIAMRAVPALLLAAPAVDAGAPSPSALRNVPDPNRSRVAVTGQIMPCQFRFRADAGLDALVVDVTVRDAFDVEVAGCSTSVTIVPNAGTQGLCSCDGLERIAFSDSAGVVHAEFARIGGHGSLDVAVTLHCAGDIAIYRQPFLFSSPDLDASCDAPASTDVFDLGAWATWLPPGPYGVEGDYNCDALVDVFDLAVFAGGLSAGCTP